MIWQLLLQGAKRDPVNAHQQTPLHLAVERQHIQIVRVGHVIFC